MEEFKQLIAIVSYGIESFGVVVIVVGSLIATARFLRHWPRDPLEETFQDFRVGVGRAIILGLEFLIAGDVIRTVVVASTLENVGVLALIVVIRTFLSFALAMEVEGRLPWQKPAKRDRA
jgi:uncharacterized membrane protein